jgi:hypothetical protein
MAPGYHRALELLLPIVGRLITSDDGLMPHYYYAYVALHVSAMSCDALHTNCSNV